MTNLPKNWINVRIVIKDDLDHIYRRWLGWEVTIARTKVRFNTQKSSFLPGMLFPSAGYGTGGGIQTASVP